MYKEKPPVNDDDDDAVIQPRAARVAQKNKERAKDAAPRVAAALGDSDENYRSRDFKEHVEDQRVQDSNESEFEGRKQVN